MVSDVSQIAVFGQTFIAFVVESWSSFYFHHQAPFLGLV